MHVRKQETLNVPMYVCMRARMNIINAMHACMCVPAYEPMYVCMHACMYVRVCVCMRVHVCMLLYISAYMSIHI